MKRVSGFLGLGIVIGMDSLICEIVFDMLSLFIVFHSSNL